MRPVMARARMRPRLEAIERRNDLAIASPMLWR